MCSCGWARGMTGLGRLVTGCAVKRWGGQGCWKGGLVPGLGGFPSCVTDSRRACSCRMGRWREGGWR